MLHTNLLGVSADFECSTGETQTYECTIVAVFLHEGKLFCALVDDAHGTTFTSEFNKLAIMPKDYLP